MKTLSQGVGAYRGDDGKPFVLPSVRKAEEIIFNKGLNHEYAAIGGDADYCKLSADLAFGDGNSFLSFFGVPKPRHCHDVCHRHVIAYH